MPKFFLIIGVIWTCFCFALPEDRNQIAKLSADSADINQKAHRGEYRGNVQFDQGTTHLRATRAITEGNEKNELQSAIAYGDKTTLAHYWEKTAADKPLLHAYAKEIHYYPERHLIELIGEAKVVQGEDSFSAQKIRYDTVKQHVLAEGAQKNPIQIIMHSGKAPDNQGTP